MRGFAGWLVGVASIVVAFSITGSAVAAPVTQNFEYTGGVQVWTVPYGVTSATFNLYGAQGRGFGPGSSAQGGRGGWARATIPVTANSQVSIRVGGEGVANAGGFNGGGDGGYGGGGATDIRTGGDSLTDRILVAGGGGGGGFSCLNTSITVVAAGGDGGGLTGWSGNNTGCSPSGTGGTQSAGGSPGGSLGQGGSGGPSGGGGGYYGGGGSLEGFSNGGPGGGGSSYGPPGFSTGSGQRQGNGLATVTYEVTETRNLFASATGPGDGYVSSSPAGIDCGVDGAPGHDDCIEAFGKDQPVTVTAHPTPGSVFDQWIFGPCQGSTQPTCSTVLNQSDPEQAKIVSARFKIAPVTETYQSTGEAVRWTMPYGATSANIDLYGAQGGGPGGRFIGGKGGRATATITPAAGTVFWLRVGGAGGLLSGGFNGGGATGSAIGNSAFGGGGATDFRTGNDTLASRILVAGGGGGGGQNCSNPSVVSTGGEGGGATGGAGTLSFADGDYPPGCNIDRASGGSQTQKGSFSVFYPEITDGGPQNVGGSGHGGGGGGYYAGGGSSGPGGGGSSYGPGGYSTESGVREGDGVAIIKYTVTQTIGLEVAASGPGDGLISSEPAGIDCGTTATHGTCYSVFGTGQPVTLSANPDEGSFFGGWGGACSGTQLTCSVTLSEARSVTASFSQGPRKLTVSKPGNGSGSVQSAPAGITCGSSCQADYPYGTSVTLTQTAATGSNFTGWTGACSGTGTCTVSMDQIRNVGATFSLQKRSLKLVKSQNGSGTVVSNPAGIDFPATSTSCLDDTWCWSAPFDYGTQVTLTSTVEDGSTLTGWGGDCEGVDADQPCVISMDQNRVAEVEFVLQKRTLDVEKTGSGAGTVVSTPTGIDCGGDCSGDFDYGTEVTLRSDPGPHSLFVGWGGPCSGTADCVVTMDQAQQVTAEFALEKRTLDVSRSGNGSGRITSQPTGIDCGIDCDGIEFDYGSQIELTATPAADSEFDGCSGACSGDDLICTVNLEEASAVGAVFSLQKRSLTVTTSGSGSGSVATTPSGTSFDLGTVVTLEATPAAGSSFSQWSGACTGTVRTCTLTIDQTRTVDAVFTADPEPLDAPPVISLIKVTPRKVKLKGIARSAIRRRGPTVRIKISESAKVRFTLRRKRGKALNFQRTLSAGTSTLRLPPRILRKLKPGKHRLTAVARDGSGKRSKTRSTGFRIIR